MNLGGYVFRIGFLNLSTTLHIQITSMAMVCPLKRNSGKVEKKNLRKDSKILILKVNSAKKF